MKVLEFKIKNFQVWTFLERAFVLKNPGKDVVLLEFVWLVAAGKREFSFCESVRCLVVVQSVLAHLLVLLTRSQQTFVLLHTAYSAVQLLYV